MLVGVVAPLAYQQVETRFQGCLPRGIRLCPKRLQILVQIPELLPHLFQGQPVGLVVRQRTRQRPFRMHPAGGMHQDVELRRTIAEDHQVR